MVWKILECRIKKNEMSSRHRHILYVVIVCEQSSMNHRTVLPICFFRRMRHFGRLLIALKENRVINKPLVNSALIYIKYVMNSFHRLYKRMYFSENSYWPYKVKKCQFSKTVLGLVLSASETK